jgi:hypothetical protein
MTETQWYKYTFLCSICNSKYVIESLTASPHCFDPICSDMDCPGMLVLMSQEKVK